MTWEDFVSAAQDAGFPLVYSVTAARFTAWEESTRHRQDPRWASMSADPQEVLPGARSVLILIRPYSPYEGFPSGSPSIDAYYPASQAAYCASRGLADALRADGYRVDDSQRIPAKHALLRTGDARSGRNSLISLPGIGTRFAIHTLVTDAPFPAVDRTPVHPLSPLCETCGACVRACPVRALDGSGAVSTERCLRAQPYNDTVPSQFRSLLGGSLLGCDLCQRACPRNSEASAVAPQDALVRALDLPVLLSGPWRPLGAWIGSNYARKAHIQGRAALLAANLQRRDTIPILRELRDGSEYPFVREHAAWALERLE